jgi:P4 family phage/plasmid primase-like protien
LSGGKMKTKLIPLSPKEAEEEFNKIYEAQDEEKLKEFLNNLCFDKPTQEYEGDIEGNSKIIAGLMKAKDLWVGGYVHFNQSKAEREYSEIFDYLYTTCGKFNERGNFLGFDNMKLHYEFSKIIISKYDTFTFADTSQIFIYRDGIYEDGEKEIKKFIQRVLGEYAKINSINETLEHVRRQTYKQRELIEEEKEKICLINGILDLKEMKVISHTPKMIFFNKINASYDKNSDCPKIKKFLLEIVGEEDVPILQEISGYCLIKLYFIHKAILFVGIGANGKSTFINLIKEFLGLKNCVSIPLQHLEEDKFALANLHGKLANLFADLPSRALRNTSIFKMLVGEDLIPAEKKFKDKFFFTNYSKQLFSCNQIPKSPEDSDAFFRRWLIVNFPNQFVNSKADKGLLKKLTTPEELSGFLNFAIEGLKRLLERQDFSNTPEIEKVRDTYIRMSDSVAAFIMDCIENSPDFFEEKKKLFTSYCDYCRENKCPIVSENTFYKEIPKQVRIEDYRPLLDMEGKKIRVSCWKGIKFINWEKPLDKVDPPDTIKEKKEFEEQLPLTQNTNLQRNVRDVKDVNSKNPIKDSSEEENKLSEVFK